MKFTITKIHQQDNGTINADATDVSGYAKARIMCIDFEVVVGDVVEAKAMASLTPGAVAVQMYRFTRKI